MLDESTVDLIHSFWWASQKNKEHIPIVLSTYIQLY